MALLLHTKEGSTTTYKRALLLHTKEGSITTYKRGLYYYIQEGSTTTSGRTWTQLVCSFEIHHFPTCMAKTVDHTLHLHLMRIRGTISIRGRMGIRGTMGIRDIGVHIWVNTSILIFGIYIYKYVYIYKYMYKYI